MIQIPKAMQNWSHKHFYWSPLHPCPSTPRHVMSNTHTHVHTQAHTHYNAYTSTHTTIIGLQIIGPTNLKWLPYMVCMCVRVCNECKRTFRRAADRTRHKCLAERHKPPIQGAVHCGICKRWFKSRGGLDVRDQQGIINWIQSPILFPLWWRTAWPEW